MESPSFQDSVKIAFQICNLNEKTRIGKTALVDYIKNKILANKSYPCTTNLMSSDFTALMHAVLSNNVEAVQKVLKYDPEQINKQNTVGCTALILIARNSGFLSNSSTIIKMLIDAEADLEIRDSKGSNALSAACAFLGSKPVCSSEDSVLLLINAGANVHILSNTKATPLMLVARSGNEKLTKIFLEKKLDVNHKNNNGNTALTYSVMDNKNSNITKMLLEVPGINIDSANNTGETALLWAAHNFKIQNLKETKTEKTYSKMEMARNIFYLLLDKGANPNLKNEDQVNAITMAPELFIDYKIYKMKKEMQEEMKQFKLQLYEELYCPSGVGFKKRLENLFKMERNELLQFDDDNDDEHEEQEKEEDDQKKNKNNNKRKRKSTDTLDKNPKKDK